MKNVLIPTDFSPESQNAINFVLGLFSEFNSQCNIVLLNTYLAPKVTQDQIIAANDLAKNRSITKLEAEKSKILSRKDIGETSITILSRMGSLTNIIPHLIKSESDSFDIIVMGKDGGKHVDEVSRALKEINSPSPLVIVYPPKD